MPGTAPGVFPPGSVIRRVDSEAALILGGGRALLLQLAHPAVAQGVADHSDFRTNALRRLMGTLDAMFTIVFGSAEAAEATASALDRVHTRVTGPGYAANDPELKMWVHATLVDTAIRVHRRFLTPLRPGEECEYYEQSMTLAEMLGVPTAIQPPDYTAFRAYMRDMVGSLEVSDVAREVASAVLRPDLPWPVVPAARLGREISIGLCPPPIRRQYRFQWDRGREAALQAAGIAARLVLPRVPAPLRRVPGARAA